MCPVLKMPEKRNLVVLGLNKKLEIIKRLEKGETAISIGQNYGVEITGNDINCDAEKLKRHVPLMQKTDGDVRSRKTMKQAKYEQLDNGMYQWFIQARNQGIPLSGPIIMTKAREMNKKLDGDPNFKASMGWLDKFKFRHGIRQININGENNSAVVAESKEKFKFKKPFDPKVLREQTNNCNGTGLNCKALSQTTLPNINPITSDSEAREMFTKCIDWYELQEGITPEQVLMLRIINTILTN